MHKDQNLKHSLAPDRWSLAPQSPNTAAHKEQKGQQPPGSAELSPATHLSAAQSSLLPAAQLQPVWKENPQLTPEESFSLVPKSKQVSSRGQNWGGSCHPLLSPSLRVPLDPLLPRLVPQPRATSQVPCVSLGHGGDRSAVSVSSSPAGPRAAGPTPCRARSCVSTRCPGTGVALAQWDTERSHSRQRCPGSWSCSSALELCTARALLQGSTQPGLQGTRLTTAQVTALQKHLQPFTLHRSLGIWWLDNIYRRKLLPKILFSRLRFTSYFFAMWLRMHGETHLVNI